MRTQTSGVGAEGETGEGHLTGYGTKAYRSYVLNALLSQGVDASAFDPAHSDLSELKSERFERVFETRRDARVRRCGETGRAAVEERDTRVGHREQPVARRMREHAQQRSQCEGAADGNRERKRCVQRYRALGVVVRKDGERRGARRELAHIDFDRAHPL